MTLLDLYNAYGGNCDVCGESDIFEGAVPFGEDVSELALAALQTVFPDGVLARFGDMDVVYQDGRVFSRVFSLFYKTRFSSWSRLGKTMEYEYNAIHNFDRTEEITETEDLDESRDSVSRGDSFGSSINTMERANLESVAAYDTAASGTMANKSKVADSGESETSATNKNTAESVENGRQSRTKKISTRLFGNIGVTTTQQMISAERENARYVLEEEILNDFKKEFIIMLY